ncbi:hypothetical protein EKO04_002091 [Ascochyta lentis]|uniref:Peptidase S53 domain-containing protein n=1 Tax=Ascochyta lentis TaxID=205686 RepID=A0A8H7JCR9_9PLEO|nr:hypothetical protein EKO04_002091 [Ascochyta lentis]
MHESQTSEWFNAWETVGKASSSTLLPVRIALRQRNLQKGEKLLLEFSNPESPKFGRHMSVQEATDFFAPEQSSVDIVTDWLVSSGISRHRVSQSTNKQWLQIRASVEELECLIYAKFSIFRRVGSRAQSIAAESYYLPPQVQQHVDYITPAIKEIPYRTTVSLQKQNRKRKVERPKGVLFQAMKRSQNGSAFDPGLLLKDNCRNYLTTECIMSQYGIPNNTLASEGNQLGLFEGDGDHYSKVALDTFFSQLHPNIPSGTYPETRLINGAVGAVEDGFVPGNHTVESNLDLMSTWPIIWPQNPVIFQTDDIYSETNSEYRGFLNTFFNAIDGSYCKSSSYNQTKNCTVAGCQDPIYPDPNPAGYQGEPMCGAFEPTNVISISYYAGETYFPPAYMKRQCLEMMKLGLQGITIVGITGDFGVGSYPYRDGGYPNGCAGSNETVFIPSVPGSCPFVLSVGGTALQASSSSDNKPHEIAPTTYASGGGFSNNWEAPTWQKKHIRDYFSAVQLGFRGYNGTNNNLSTAGDGHGGVYNTQGRGFPDVAAFSTNFLMFNDGVWGRLHGTSLSGPIWGAILTVINEERLKVGKNTIGFINPILYAHPEVFTDITVGSNPGCHSPGFQCAKGWDPVTGLGTPNFPKLLDLFLSLP